MPAAPKQDRKRSEERPNAQAGPSRRALPYEQRDPSGLPGVSKLKASIRQTKRLLAKEGILPALRIQTQRRLTSLEADLAKAERRQVESKNGERYHMVKFFDRQKLVRLIKRSKRQAEAAIKPKEKKRAERELEEARVMLNYVLHFPNDKKYSAIFAPSTASESGQPSDAEGLTLPRLLPRKDDQPDLDALPKHERARLELLLETRQMMRSGQLSLEPEVELKERKRDAKEKRVERIVIGKKDSAAMEQGTVPQKDKKGSTTQVAEEVDDFFEAD